MATVMRFEIPGGTSEQYEQVTEELGIGGEGDAPDGLVLHVCGATGDGVLLADDWESPATRQVLLQRARTASRRTAGSARRSCWWIT